MGVRGPLGRRLASLGDAICVGTGASGVDRRRRRLRGEFDPDFAYIRAFELFCVRAGVKVLSLSARGVAGIGDAIAVHRPNVVVLAGGHLSDDTVAGWAYSARLAAGAAPVAVFRRGDQRARTRTTRISPLPPGPSEAQSRLLELIEAYPPQAFDGDRNAAASKHVSEQHTIVMRSEADSPPDGAEPQQREIARLQQENRALQAEVAGLRATREMIDEPTHGDAVTDLAQTRPAHQLDAAEQVALLGSWEWRPVTHTYRWSENLYRIFGIEPGEITPDS